MSLKEDKRTMREVIEAMKYWLRPGGTGNVVYLDLLNDHYWNADFVAACVKEVENMALRASLGEPVTPLEHLGFMVLYNSCGLVNPREKEKPNED